MDSLDPSVKCTSRSKARILDLFTNISSKPHSSNQCFWGTSLLEQLQPALRRRQGSCHQFDSVTAGCLQIVLLAGLTQTWARFLEGVFKGAIAICLNHRATARRLAENSQMESKLPKS